VNELSVYNFIFQHSRRHCPNIKSWNQLLYPRVIEVWRQPFEPRHDFILHLIIVVELFPGLLGFRSVVKTVFHLQSQWSPETRLLPVHSPFALKNCMTERISHLAELWIGAAISNTFHSKPVLPLSNEHGSQLRIKVDGSVAIIGITNFSIGLHVMYLYFTDAPRT
jgi:hypothetical protein